MSDKIIQLASLLTHLESDVRIEKLPVEVRKFLANVGPQDVIQAEQFLLESGFTLKALRHLSNTYRAIFGPQITELRQNLSYNHILRSLFCEHEMVLCSLSDLYGINRLLQSLDEISDVSSEFRRLAHISEHLSAAILHCEKEDYVIFPNLDNHGCCGLGKALGVEHANISTALANLDRLVKGFGEFECWEFKLRLAGVAQFLTCTFTEHIFWEDYILYPVAFEIAEDEKMWDRMKCICDELGYCGLHVSS